MQALRYRTHGDPEVLEIETTDRPTPAKSEVLVAIHATSVNGLDVARRSGRLPESAFPKIPGVDVAGVIEAVGDSVTEFDVGDRVFGVGYGSDGTYADFVTLPVANLVPLPANVSYVNGAAIAHVGMTAWRAIIDHGNLGLTDTCLIHGGAGGVGHLAVQFGAETGADVIATAGTEKTLDRVPKFGADTILDFRRDDLADAISETADDGVDVILDSHLDHYLELDVEVAAHDARVVTIAGNDPKFDNASMARSKDLTIQAMAVFNTPDYSRILKRLGHLLETDRLEPEIAETYGLEEAVAAQQAFEEVRLGKIMLTGR
jgi:NADPH2:quinone reductase